MRAVTVMMSAALALSLGGYAAAQTPAMPSAVHVMNGMIMDAKG